jgi:hypothetical protein
MNASPGRPRDFTPELQFQFLELVAKGSTVAQAAWGVGVSLRTVQREAKANDGFHHELELAQQASPVHPEQLLREAARTHWRAAAWMLERSDPERFGKRPPTSCSPEKLQTLVAHLIELTLEATPSDQRRAVYQHVRAGADKALEALLPDQRRLTALAAQPTPLSDHESTELEDAAEAPPATRAPSSATLPPAAVGSELSPATHPPDGGIMSPKMHIATECNLRETAPSESAVDATDPDASTASRPRRRARDVKALHILEREQARRDRRKAARAKRKGRDAA